LGSESGIGFVVPKVILDHQPEVTTLAIDSDETLARLSDERNLALNPRDIPTIRSYFLQPEVQRQRQKVGLADPTDVELEYISQARSDHCNHNTFGGRFAYRDLETGDHETIDSLFKTYHRESHAGSEGREGSGWFPFCGTMRASGDSTRTNYVITGETHNSPSNMEAYGGAITGIVGIYRDPHGDRTGLQADHGKLRLLCRTQGLCGRPCTPAASPKAFGRRHRGRAGRGQQKRHSHPFGQVLFNEGYLGKCLVFVTALGIMPKKSGKPSDQKTTIPGDLAIMCGGRVGKDGIHGVTASSATFSENTPAGHVQIGDPYTQKKMHDFLLEARDQGLIRFITDNGGGGLSVVHGRKRPIFQWM
jgi:phosphoribosylformylglycinamidine (FGAM) synthase-like enzyme